MNIAGKWTLGLVLSVVALLALFLSADSGEAAVREAALVVAVAAVIGVFGVLNWAFDDRQRQVLDAAPAAEPISLQAAALRPGQFSRPDARLVLAYFWASFLFFASAI